MVNQIVKSILRTPILGRLSLIPYRFILSTRYLLPKISHQLGWLFSSKETTNLTYDIEDLNQKYLVNFIANLTNTSFSIIENYMHEIKNNSDLENHLKELIKNSEESYKADINIKYGRRIGWYALIRTLKPKVVIETGVDKGLGSCIITSALKKNIEEGYLGKYYGTDINPKAGYLFTFPYNKYGQIIYGDSIESLTRMTQTIDLFINDSDHSAKYEGMEYETIHKKLSKNAIIVGDNSHITEELFKFSQKTNRKFYFFKEIPKNHWHQGAGIGISI